MIEIVPTVHRDERGFFLESYQMERYKALGLGPFVQDNHSFSKRGVLRGLHFQKGQAKLIYCPRGRIFDVAVHLETGEWKGFYLDGETHRQLYIPDGYAHGFCVLSEEAHVLYKVSTYFDPALEQGFAWDSVGIAWPVQNPILSKRDANARSFHEVLGRR